MKGSDCSRRSKCDIADGGTCEIVNCAIVSASGINSLDPRQCEVICRVTNPQHVTIHCILSLFVVLYTAKSITEEQLKCNTQTRDKLASHC